MSAFSDLMRRARAAGAWKLAFYVDLELAVDRGQEGSAGLSGPTDRTWMCHVVKDGRSANGRSGEEALRRVVQILESDPVKPEDRQH